jgi:hypothetical protein
MIFSSCWLAISTRWSFVADVPPVISRWHEMPLFVAPGVGMTIAMSVVGLWLMASGLARLYRLVYREP